MSDEVLARVYASAPRRFLGVGMMAGLGGLMLYIAFATPPALQWQVFLLMIGGGALWVAQVMWQATSRHLVLTDQDLRDSEGRVLVTLDNVERVDRGAFAFKPSNGFIIRTRSKQERAWQPGLWWRFGRRVAVGGVTPSSQTKPMADIMAMILADRGQVDRGF